jgi:hypothetical protein
VLEPKIEETAGGWTKAHHEELHNVLVWWRLGGHVACREERRNVFKDFIGDPKRKTPHRRCMCRWKDDSKMDLK